MRRHPRNLAQIDALRELISFSQLLPTSNGNSTPRETSDSAPTRAFTDRLLHARVQGTKLGVFDLYFDSLAGEQIQAGQARTAENGITYYDVFTSFSPLAPGSSGSGTGAARPTPEDSRHGDHVAIRHFAINCKVTPPTQIHAE